MSETILQSASIASSSTASGTCAKDATQDVLTLVVSEFDGNSDSLEFSASGGSSKANGTIRPLTHNGSNKTGIDATGDGAVVLLDGLEGVKQVEVTVTNGGSSSTTVTVEEETP